MLCFDENASAQALDFVCQVIFVIQIQLEIEANKIAVLRLKSSWWNV